MGRRTAPRLLVLIVVLLALLLSIPTRGDDRSTGPDGINSQRLPLTGAKVAIAQIEGGRPGFPGKDSDNQSNPAVKPAAVFISGIPVDFPKQKDEGVRDHAEGVAGIVIADPAVVKSVASGALLYSSTDGSTLAFQGLISNSKAPLRAINASFGVLVFGKPFDGTEELTMFVDWSSRVHNVLYCVSGPEGTGADTPSDLFNGVSVGSSDLIVGGVYRQVAKRNDLRTTSDKRHLNGLIAPGEQIETTDLGVDAAKKPKLFTKSGTSFAAPHLTGTVALLQEFSDKQIAAKTKGFGVESRQHEVVKAVLLNSADKLKDNGDGKLLGMQKDVVQKDGKTDWLQSKDHDDKNPLDLQMGTGQLNASRAVAQLEPGKQPHAAPVPLIGWDFSMTKAKGEINKYVFDKALLKDSYVAITLAWDRHLDLVKKAGNKKPDQFESGDTFADKGLTNMDLYLLPKGAKEVKEAVARSISPNYSVEHIFFQVTKTADYEFWVVQVDAPHGAQPYGIAWHAFAGQCPKEKEKKPEKKSN